MDIGIGLDHSLRLGFPEQRTLIHEAVELGYTSAWTPAAAVSRDAFHICAQWSAAAGPPGGGFTTGISVVPAPMWTAPTLAMQAGTVGELTGGRFILGIGSGSIDNPAVRASFGLTGYPVISGMRDYLITLRGLLAGEAVDHDGKAVTLHGVQLGFRPPRVPVYLAALGPQMLRLAGEASDGALLNWCAPEQIAWSRERVAEGARRAGRDPGEVQIVEYIRICVDEDEDVARRALARATIGYATARPGVSKDRGYRGHFARMGFDDALTELEARRDRGASEDELVEAFPTDLLLRAGYFGKPAGAASAFDALARGLDVAIVRVVPARSGIDAVRAVMQACRPALVTAG